MIVPRNTLVVLRLIETTEKKLGNGIVVPTAKDQYCDATVIAVGPGIISASGGRSDCFDLHPGQRVFVKHKTKGRNQMGECLVDEGIPFTDGEVKYMIFEQTNIMGVYREPSTFTSADLVKGQIGDL